MMSKQIESNDTHMRSSVSPEEKLVITLSYLGWTVYYKTCKGVYTPKPPTRRHSPAAWCRRLCFKNHVGDSCPRVQVGGMAGDLHAHAQLPADTPAIVT
ncbi:unnamed protein product [Plutella xylostella]|uniref:(diamondback moth) hypothetical protein n=1 Tax=Plutella xylostella TaxID=51655 RepID=A0A8S4FBL7_PLUXY|nr:unnamed protein product [Plutella xylostella]